MNLQVPETILPSQFFDRLHTNAARHPEQRLMLAVLADAVTVFQRYAGGTTPRARRRFAEAAEWFLSNENDGPFSFTNVCEALALEPEYIRRGLNLWRHQCSSGKPPTVVRLVIRDRSGSRHGVNGRPYRCARRRRSA
jgi:hypothetical protein